MSRVWTPSRDPTNRSSNSTDDASRLCRDLQHNLPRRTFPLPYSVPFSLDTCRVLWTNIVHPSLARRVEQGAESKTPSAKDTRNIELRVAIGCIAKSCRVKNCPPESNDDSSRYSAAGLPTIKRLSEPNLDYPHAPQNATSSTTPGLKQGDSGDIVLGII